MVRRIIRIDEEKCNGCGLCTSACQEGAIALVDGKAKLIRDDYCDGLGNCLPACPTQAISFEEREAKDFDEDAVKAHLDNLSKKEPVLTGGGCPGSKARTITRTTPKESVVISASESQLLQWPVQIKLVPVRAPYYENANLLIAADCSAYAYADFHNRFIQNHIAIIGCPKLDEGNYADKLTAILTNNNIKSVTVVRMEVPCCGGIANAAIEALKNCDKMIPWQIVTISTDGHIIE